MISVIQANLMRRTIELLREWRPYHEEAKPFAVMLLEDGRRLEVNSAQFVRLALNCLKEIAMAAPREKEYPDVQKWE